MVPLMERRKRTVRRSNLLANLMWGACRIMPTTTNKQRLLTQLFAAYKNRGVEIVSPPRDRPWGLRQFEIRDCDGYLLTFAAEIGIAG